MLNHHRILLFLSPTPLVQWLSAMMSIQLSRQHVLNALHNNKTKHQRCLLSCLLNIALNNKTKHQRCLLKRLVFTAVHNMTTSAPIWRRSPEDRKGGGEGGAGEGIHEGGGGVICNFAQRSHVACLH